MDKTDECCKSGCEGCPWNYKPNERENIKKENIMCPKCEKKVSFKKSLLALFLVMVAVWSLDSFASGNMDHSKMDHSKMDHSKMKKDSKRKQLTEGAKKSVINVLQANEELHNSFFKYDGKKVEEAAQKLKSAIDRINDSELTKLLKFSKTKLADIKASSSRDDNNQNYHLVSMALIHIVNTYDVGSKYNAYSCPMVKKKWVQNSKKMAKVHNPYAPNMPHCGSKDSNH
ncbi:MAG: hypothetical protein CME70_11385 [Halobacteriovorax sp.]|nr:hypothetical protein [Halobacteriovorax sp.]|tara:strand:- start:76984 stop:77670 length:687 start_codon:yes stop_codon:yes gene_type:complete